MERSYSATAGSKFDSPYIKDWNNGVMRLKPILQCSRTPTLHISLISCFDELRKGREEIESKLAFFTAPILYDV